MSGFSLVTGATGLIGGHVARRLVADGRPVRVLVRQAQRLDEDLRDSLDLVVGDLRDERAIARAMEGVSEVYHLAACAKVWSRDPDEYHDVNVRAVRALLDRAADEGVHRFVHVSTILTLPPHAPAPLGPRAQRLTPYETTKREGERVVERFAAERGHAVIVHPTRVYGPGPLNDANAATRMVALYLRGRFRLRLADGDVLGNYVHAADVAEGMVLAGRKGRPGGHYTLGGENLSLRKLLNLVAEVAEVHPRRVIPLPTPAALAIGHASLFLARLGGPALLTPEWIRTFLEDRRVDNGRTREELGYRPRPLREGLAETIQWLRREGYVS
jgi:nucleoside-diphosphate-sugar epimerase